MIKFCLHIYFYIFIFYFFSNIFFEKINEIFRKILNMTMLFFYIQKVYTYAYFLYARGIYAKNHIVL